MARRRRSFPRDPHFITARFPGTCGNAPCSAPIQADDRVFHYCSDGAARRFAAEVAGEGACAW